MKPVHPLLAKFTERWHRGSLPPGAQPYWDENIDRITDRRPGSDQLALLSRFCVLTWLSEIAHQRATGKSFTSMDQVRLKRLQRGLERHREKTAGELGFVNH